MNPLAIQRTPSANDAPLSIRQILEHGLAKASAKASAQACAEEIAQAIAQEIAQECAQDCAQEVAQEIAQEFAQEIAQEIAREIVQEIVYADRVRFSYATLGERVNRLASALAELGVRPGSTVAMMDWDSHRYLECFFAVPMMGAVLHTVNVRISPDQILYTINHAADDVILVNSEFLPILEAIRDRIRPGVVFVLIDDAMGTSHAAPKTKIAFAAEYETMLARASPSFAFPDLPEDTRATTFYTTGTTGLPKGVYYSHRQLVLHTLGAMQALGNATHATFNSEDVYMPVTPMFHVHAWGLPYVATMLGVKQVYPGRYQPDALLALITRERVTFSHCVPTILSMMLGSPALREGQLEGWKVIIGGSALPLPLARAAVEKGIDVIAGYGMSETCPILTLAHLRPHMSEWCAERKLPVLCRAGRPIPFVQLRVVDADMNDVAHDGVAQGEVVVRAPWLTQGYLNEPAKSEELWRGGWLHTGDVGAIDSEGYLKIVDRIKDVVKTGGEWVSSLDIEDLVLRMPGIAEAAVVGVPDARWGERPVCFVVRKPLAEAQPGEDAVRRHVQEFAERGAISKFAVPDRVYFVNAIPKTSVGKLDKKVIRARLADAAASAKATREAVPAPH